MVVDRNGKRLFRLILADDILVEDGADIFRLRYILELYLYILAELFFDDLVAKFDAFITNVDTRASYELPHLVLRLAAE